MTISSNAAPKAGPFNGNGVQTVFPFTFHAFSKNDLLVVTAVTISGVETTLVVDSDYTVALNADQSANPGGSITYPISGSPLPAGSTLTIVSDIEYTQITDLINGGGFYPDVIEDSLDRGVMQGKQILEIVSRTLQVAVSTPSNVDVTLPAPSASQLIGWNAAGDGLVNYVPDASSAAGLQVRLADTAGASNGDFMIGVKQPFTGAVGRTQHAQNSDLVSVIDFGAVGDGTTDDTAAIQAAENTGKAVYWPKPASFYKVTTAIAMSANPRWFGERGVTTIIRRTNGAGAVLDFPGGNQNGVIENLTIGGIGATGITVAGGGYANYLSTLSLRNVHFEGDQLVNINANLIHCNFTDCTFGYFTQTSVNANLRHIVSSFAGGNLTNVNTFINCKFFNGGTTVAAVSFTSGLVLNFYNCAWENNGRDLATSNVQNCLLLNCYSERGKHATSQFDFNLARGRVKVLGGQFNGSALMPAAAAMFRADTGCPLLVEDADISTTASAFTYTNASTGAHLPPGSGVHQFASNRYQGNAADPLLSSDAVLASVLTPKAWAIVNSAGGGGSVVESSHTGTTLTKNGTGDMSVTFPVNIATTAAQMGVNAMGNDSDANGFGTSVSTCRVQMYSRANPAILKDDIFFVVVYGK